MQPGAGRPPSQPLLPSDYTNVGLMRVQGVKVSDCDQTRSLLVTILDEHKAKLDRQAVVKIHDEGRDTTTWLTTSRDSQLLFCIEPGTYDLEASAVGYLTGVPSVCVSTVGPGATNLTTGVGCAWLDRLPVLALTCNVPSGWLRRRIQMRIDHCALFGPLTKDTRVLTPHTLDQAIVEPITPQKRAIPATATMAR